VITDIGPLDEGYFLHCEDLDWSLFIQFIHLLIQHVVACSPLVSTLDLIIDLHGIAICLGS